MPSDELSNNERVSHYIEIWKQTIQVQQHFNDIEWRIRGLALSVLTFALGAAAVAAGRGERLGPMSVGTLVLLAGLLLWYAFYFVDKAWYHRLLKAAVGQGERLEDTIERDLPGIGLTKAISAGSPYLPKPLFGKIRFRKTAMDSTDKLNRFYGVGAAALLLLAVALQFSPSPDMDSDDEDISSTETSPDDTGA